MPATATAARGGERSGCPPSSSSTCNSNATTSKGWGGGTEQDAAARAQRAAPPGEKRNPGRQTDRHSHHTHQTGHAHAQTNPRRTPPPMLDCLWGRDARPPNERQTSERAGQRGGKAVVVLYVREHGNGEKATATASASQVGVRPDERAEQSTTGRRSRGGGPRRFVVGCRFMEFLLGSTCPGGPCGWMRQGGGGRASEFLPRCISCMLVVACGAVL